jgi:hypothetical protein
MEWREKRLKENKRMLKEGTERWRKKKRKKGLNCSLSQPLLYVDMKSKAIS